MRRCAASEDRFDLPAILFIYLLTFPSVFAQNVKPTDTDVASTHVTNLTVPNGDTEGALAHANYGLVSLNTEIMNFSAAADESRQQPEQAKPETTRNSQQTLPNAPSSSSKEPSLSDLGLTPEQTQGNAKEQAVLDKRTHMLKIHQRMGLITTVPMIASVVTSLNAGGRSTSKSSRDLHAALGGLTGDLYFITAYYAIRAPRIPGTQTRGPIRFHKTMAWIHGPGMVMTPILGIIAFDQKSKGERVHGIASAHGPVAIVTAGAFGAALLSVSVKF